MPQLRITSLRLVLAILLLVATTASVVARPAAQSPATQQQLEQIERQTSEMRGLELLAPIPFVFITPEELYEDLRRQIFEEFPEEDREASQYLLEAFGYIEPGFDILTSVLNVLSEGTLGYYSPKDKTFRLITTRDRLTPGDVLTIAHELTHALQDQHYDLEAGHEERRNQNDRSLAYSAMLEGDATVSMVLYGRQFLSAVEFLQAVNQSSGGDSGAFDTAPLILQRELLFPYDEGAQFVIMLYQMGGWAAVDEAWKNPPESTEQILHPDKYLEGERPIDLPMPDLAGPLGGDWRMLDEDTLGELDWTILFEQHAGERVANQAARGWGGDHYQLFLRDSDGAVVLGARTAWDSERDAMEFFDGYVRLAEGRHRGDVEELPAGVIAPALAEAVQGGRAWAGHGDGWSHIVARDGQHVLLVITTDVSAATPVMQTLWSQPR
jgi:hypothetical protein